MEDGDTYFLSLGESQRIIQPQFEIVMDGLQDLFDRLSLSSDDLVLGLSVRSPHLKKYVVVERWPIDSLPEVPWSPEPARLEPLQTGRGMDFIFAFQVAKSRNALSSQGLSRGKVLCRKVFSVRESIESFTFPFQWVEFGGASGYPEEALWVVEWNLTDDDVGQFDRPIDEVLTVFGNKKAEPSLSAMGNVPNTNDLAWKMLATEITTQIWADVLEQTEVEPEETDTETLVGQVFAKLSSVSNRPYSEIRGLINEDDSRNTLRNMVARVLRLVI